MTCQINLEVEITCFADPTLLGAVRLPQMPRPWIVGDSDPETTTAAALASSGQRTVWASSVVSILLSIVSGKICPPKSAEYCVACPRPRLTASRTHRGFDAGLR